MASSHVWLPKLSDKLCITLKTYPILAHGLPVSFDPARNSQDVHVIISYNNHIITHSATLQHVDFLHCLHSSSQAKLHTSFVLYFTNPKIAKNCIAHWLAFQGCLLSTAKFVQKPPQCYNCHCNGHLTWSCKKVPIGGLCSGPHTSPNCQCPNQLPCAETAPCKHVMQKCGACSGPHVASDVGCLLHAESQDWTGYPEYG